MKFEIQKKIGMFHAQFIPAHLIDLLGFGSSISILCQLCPSQRSQCSYLKPNHYLGIMYIYDSSAISPFMPLIFTFPHSASAQQESENNILSIGISLL